MKSRAHLPLLAGLVGAALTMPAAGVAAPSVSAVSPSTSRPAGAAGAPALPTRYLRGGPQFLGDGRVAWFEADGQDWGIRAGVPDRKGSTTTLVRGHLHHDELDDEGDFSDDVTAPGFAAAGTLGVIGLGFVEGSTKVQVYSAGAEVRAYDLTTGKSRTLDVCTRRTEGFEPSPPSAAFATDGVHIAVSLCTDTKIFDTTGAAPVATLPTNPYAVDVAGPYVATASSGAVTVRDWTTGATAYSVKLPETVLEVGFALQSDGALALVTLPSPPSGGRPELTWHTPADPVGTVLPVTPSTTRIGAAGGKAIVTVASPTGVGNVITEIGPSAPDLPLAYVSTNAAPAFGYRDGRVALGRTGCDGAGSIELAAGDASPVASDCPDLVVKRAKRTGRRLGVSLTYRRGFADTLRLTYRAGKRTVRFSLAPRQGTLGIDTTFRLPKWAIDKRAKLTVSYAGGRLFIPQTARRDVHG